MPFYIFAPHMGRYITAIVLLAAFAMQTFQQGITILGYYTNTSSFARNCENKAMPLMHCNGKCQLMKKLQAEEKQGGQLPERKLANNTEVISSKTSFPILSSTTTQLSTSWKGIAAFFISQGYCTCIFHPPATV